MPIFYRTNNDVNSFGTATIALPSEIYAGPVTLDLSFLGELRQLRFGIGTASKTGDPQMGTYSATDNLILRNVTFSPLQAVPEPSTWAMMVFGFGIVGFSARRKKQLKLGCAQA